MHATKYAFILSITVFVATCSNRQIYDSIQHKQKLQCISVPASQYDSCLSQNRQNFNEYSDVRKEILHDKQTEKTDVPDTNFAGHIHEDC